MDRIGKCDIIQERRKDYENLIGVSLYKNFKRKMYRLAYSIYRHIWGF